MDVQKTQRKITGAIGKDGLTRAQRYYRRHPHVKEKKRELQRERRHKQKLMRATQADDHCLSTSETRMPPSTLRNAPVSGSRDAIHLLVRLRAEVECWVSKWGGLSNWASWLEFSHIRALEGGYVEKWKELIAEHARAGQHLLTRVQDIANQDLPPELYQVREVWRAQMVLAERLTAGITLVNLKCSILPTHFHLLSRHGLDAKPGFVNLGSMASEGSGSEEDESSNESDSRVEHERASSVEC